jgi:hypothetical protein
MSEKDKKTGSRFKPQPLAKQPLMPTTMPCHIHNARSNRWGLKKLANLKQNNLLFEFNISFWFNSFLLAPTQALGCF